MAQYRKRPVVIEAIRFTGDTDSIADIASLASGEIRVDYAIPDAPVLKIETLEGTMTAGAGDYIIWGVGGEVYPCKSYIFEETYEPVVLVNSENSYETS